MDERQEWRFSNLSRPDVDLEFLKELHGLDWPFNDALRQDFDQFVADRHPGKPTPNDRAPRFLIEQFFEIQEVQSIGFAAAALGMHPESLQELLPRLPELGLRMNYEPYGGMGLIARSLSEDLTRKLPGLRFKTFGTHDAFCELLHNALTQTLTLKVKPLLCKTQEEVAAPELGYRMYAATWDNLTMQPLSIRHQVWLDLGKPLSLPPDRCSKLFYARHHDLLRGKLAGSGEPRDLDAYFQFLERGQHA